MIEARRTGIVVLYKKDTVHVIVDITVLARKRVVEKEEVERYQHSEREIVLENEIRSSSASSDWSPREFD